MDAGRLDLRPGLAAEPWQAAHRQWVEYLAEALFRDDRESVGLGQIRGDLGHQLVRRYANRGSQTGDLADTALDTSGDSDRVAKELAALGDVEERLIE